MVISKQPASVESKELWKVRYGDTSNLLRVWDGHHQKRGQQGMRAVLVQCVSYWERDGIVKVAIFRIIYWRNFYQGERGVRKNSYLELLTVDVSCHSQECRVFNKPRDLWGEGLPLGAAGFDGGTGQNMELGKGISMPTWLPSLPLISNWLNPFRNRFPGHGVYGKG